MADIIFVEGEMIMKCFSALLNDLINKHVACEKYWMMKALTVNKMQSCSALNAESSLCTCRHTIFDRLAVRKYLPCFAFHACYFYVCIWFYLTAWSPRMENEGLCRK